MWVFTLDGFYSAVAHRTIEDALMVRTRTAADAQRLADWLLTRGLTAKVQHTPKGDYGWRLEVPKAAWGEYLADRATDIEYDNFKHAVAQRMGQDRADVYTEVWVDLLQLQHPKTRRATIRVRGRS